MEFGPVKKRDTQAKVDKRREQIHAQKAAGLCCYHGCGKKPKEGRAKCHEHLAAARVHALNSLYKKRKSS